MRSAARLLAAMAATRATRRTSPLVARPSRIIASVAGAITMRPVARATRWVMSFPPTSTMRARPASSKWVKCDSPCFAADIAARVPPAFAAGVAAERPVGERAKGDPSGVNSLLAAGILASSVTRTSCLHVPRSPSPNLDAASLVQRAIAASLALALATAPLARAQPAAPPGAGKPRRCPWPRHRRLLATPAAMPYRPRRSDRRCGRSSPPSVTSPSPMRARRSCAARA